MSRPGAPEPKNWATNSLRNGLVSQSGGWSIFPALGHPDESDWMSQHAVVQWSDSRSILLAFIQSHLISLLPDRKSMNFWSKAYDTGVSAEDAELAKNQIRPPALSKDRTKTSLC